MFVVIEIFLVSNLLLRYLSKKSLLIFLALLLQLITDLDLTLPFCLSPIFIVIVFKLGASIIPLEEFPIIMFDNLRHDKKFVLPNDFI